MTDLTPSRRFVVGTLFAASSYFALSNAADALFLKGGGVASTAQTFIRSVTAINTSAVTPIAANLFPDTIFIKFKKGDLPAGQYPAIYIHGTSTPVPYTYWNKLTWSDGSWKGAGFLLRNPNSVAANGSVQFDVFTNGTAPNPSGLTTANLLAGGNDLSLNATGLGSSFNLTGTWSSSLSDGITNNPGQVFLLGDGDAGAVWRIGADFKQSGSAHGQLYAEHYVIAGKDGSGGFAGYRHNARYGTPFYDVNSPAKTWMAFSALTLSGSLSADIWVNHTGQVINFTGALPVPPVTYSEFTSASDLVAGKIQTTYLAQISAGSPAPLDPNTPYFFKVQSSSAFVLGTNPASITNTVSAVALSAVGSGTLSVYPWLTGCFGSNLTLDQNGKYRWVQAGGSVATEGTYRWQLTSAEKLYDRGTGILPAWDLSFTPNSMPTTYYEPHAVGPVIRAFNQTGGRADIGQTTQWSMIHFSTQAAVDELSVRVTAAAQTGMPTWCKSRATMTIPCVNNGHNQAGAVYSGMPAPNFNFFYDGTTAQGWTIPTNTNIRLQGFSEMTTDHMPNFCYYAYMAFGEPHLLDQIISAANSAVSVRAPAINPAIPTAVNGGVGLFGERNLSINGVITYGNVFGNAFVLRDDAWAESILTSCVVATPPSYFECPSYNQYFNDMLDTTYSTSLRWTSFMGSVNSYAQTNGMWHMRAQGGVAESQAIWQLGYKIGATCLAVAAAEKTGDGLTLLNYLVKWPAHLYHVFSGWVDGYYYSALRTGVNASDPFISSDDQFLYKGSSSSWSSSTNLITFPPSAGINWVLGNGDKFIFATNPPAGIAIFQQMWAYNVSGNTCNFSTTDPAITITPFTFTDIGSNTDSFFQMPATFPSTGGNCLMAADLYMSNIRGILKWATAAGATVDAACVADLDSRLSVIPLSQWQVSPRWRMVSAF